MVQQKRAPIFEPTEVECEFLLDNKAMTDKALVAAFTEWSVATYANRFDGFSGESFTTSGETPLPNGDVLVRTALNRVNDSPVQLNYLTRRTAGGPPKIVDAYLTGTISELASRRADFATVLRDGGADRLTAALRRRAADLRRGCGAGYRGVPGG